MTDFQTFKELYDRLNVPYATMKQKHGYSMFIGDHEFLNIQFNDKSVAHKHTYTEIVFDENETFIKQGFYKERIKRSEKTFKNL